MPFVEIQELSADKESHELYLLIALWATKIGHDNGNPPLITNDFIMQIRPTETRIVTDANGFWKRASDGVFIDPATLEPGDTTEWEHETVQRPRSEIIDEIKGNVRNYFQQAVANKWRGDHTGDSSKPFFVNNVQQNKGNGRRRDTDMTDRWGLLGDTTIAALRGAGVDLG